MAALLVAGEAAALLGVGVAELVGLSADRIGLGVTVAVFFAVCGLGVGWSAAGIWRGDGWARGPLVATQLLVLGVAWSTRAELPWAAAVAALWALAVLGLLLRPAATRTLGH